MSGNGKVNHQKILIAGGGTGGHIYPGIAIARAIQKNQPEYLIEFVGSAQGLETKIVPREGFPLHLIPIGKLNFSGQWIEKVKTISLLPWSFFKTFILLLRVKPSVVIGVGGYASGPVVLIASILGIPTAIWEPNAHPGLTNRWLSRCVDTAFVVFDQAKEFLASPGIETVGLPVRAELEQKNKMLPAHQSVDPVQSVKGKKFHVLIFGGSQGARAINHIVTQALHQNPDLLKDVEIVHQTGPHDFEQARRLYADLPIAGATAHEFLYDMHERYAWADLVFCRAGASTVAELAAVQKATIFIPLPWAADDHQRKNAQTLVDAQAAECIVQKDFTPQVFVDRIRYYQKHPEVLQKMQQNIQQFYKARSADTIAEKLIEMSQT